MFRDVAAEISQMWIAEGIPIHDRNYVVKKIRAEYQAYRKLNKTKSEERPRKSNDRFTTLFDLARCKCASQQTCCCPREWKLPDAEWSFVQDQRGAREMVLGGLDARTSADRRARYQRREPRNRHEHGAGANDPVPGPSATGVPAVGSARADASTSTSADSTDDSDEPAAVGTQDPDFEAAHNETSDRNNDTLRLTAMAADRYGVSNRAVAAIVNAFQMDVGRVTSEDESLLVAPKKIWRARNQARKELTKEAAEAVTESGLTSLYFDGRKDKTCADYTSATETEEHVVVLSEPDSLYVSHFTPQSGSALDMFHELYSISLMFGGEVKVLGCDGTAVNTGVNGGVCRLFELISGKAVHWFVCQLHSNELNLRHVLQKLDGTTSGP